MELVLAGHGDPITDPRALIDERFKLHDRRADKLHRLITERPRTAYEVAQALWGNVAVTQAYLTLSEVLAHTDLLAVPDGCTRLSATGSPCSSRLSAQRNRPRNRSWPRGSNAGRYFMRPASPRRAPQRSHRQK